ncbi:portal protein [Microbacterium phage Megan]|uniref:Portal protein n=1 Tax=Microbacterium phage Megan TaxID=2656551 RepID=A0A649VKG2_9CAUD|nr:portal protein [Microbacterium phage Megan]QGJ92684.1 portal protein [Microbacterium phage Megan]
MPTMSAREYITVPVGPSPTDLPDLGAITPAVELEVAPPAVRSRPNSLTAAAVRLTQATIGKRSTRGRSGNDNWQEDAWEMYDLVGELRFITNLLANQMSKARFYVGTIADNPTDTPVPTDDEVLKGALEAIGDGPSGFIQLVKRLGVNLQIPGDGWLVGIPRWMEPGSLVAQPPEGTPVNLDDLVWHSLSVTEVEQDGDDLTLSLGELKEEKVTAKVDDIYAIRVWDPHPRRFWESDSATRSNLPVLRELVGLTMHISAQIDSRLAGAGVLLAPASAAAAVKRMMNLPEDGEDDPFTDSLIKAMMTPIQDRSNASAYVPLVWTVPDESEPHFRFMSFAKELDAQAKDMRDEAIRRFALGADAPADLLLGVGGMNHWGAWLVQEDTVRAHLEPPIALVADALTVQYIRPIMRELTATGARNYTDEQIDNTLIWYEVEHLIVKANAREDADKAHAAGVISDDAYRKALGFGDEDAPPAAASVDVAVQTALDMVKQAPSLAQDPGIPALVEQLRAVISGQDTRDPAVAEPVDSAAEAEEDAEVDREAGGPPTPEDTVPDALPASAGLFDRRPRRRSDVALTR